MYADGIEVMIYPLVLASPARIYVGIGLVLAFAQAKSYYQLPAPEASILQGIVENK